MSTPGEDLKKKTKAELIAELQKPKPNTWLTSFYNFNLKALKWGSLAGASLLGLTAIMVLAKNNPELLKKVVVGLWENTQALVQGGSVGFAVNFINSMGVWDLLEQYTGQQIYPELQEATAKTLLYFAPIVAQIKPSLIPIPDLQMEPIDSDVSMGGGNSPATTIDIPITTSPLLVNMEIDMPIVEPPKPKWINVLPSVIPQKRPPSSTRPKPKKPRKNK
jgi:hypothetical protein